ncbi:hypothetical protein KHC33_03280 [Methanospirillum sp. J.3.6.1-F.2.7.3]|uniref:Uncharacterized protein n=1 Tax=Methanospirillum purgamenti TaxID=2834276 RepID=A0A8E7B1X3_9EURY|nr:MULTISPECIES: hypothetical protein [Methanospirillum]MDX8549808.1 hypothetical protein [Methanospirillum hungatei]QVV89558.1 hypothetical protein KHC33_03280 [Methanospirillum sp. J.3.6.1-F.2.7.3]
MKREQALSEVIGFLMIVSLLAILFSMYLLYVVPIQGRDAEISHMKYITQEFIGLKADIDGLIINDKINLPIARSFELGTLSSVGSGSLSVMPMSSYIEASGTLMVNEQNDFLEVVVNGDMTDLSSLSTTEYFSSNYSKYYSESYLNFYPKLSTISCKDYNKCPPSPINFTIFDRFYNITLKKRPVLENVFVTINLSNITYSPTPTPIPSPTPQYMNATATITFPITREIHDLILEIWDNRTYPNRILTGERTIIENITLDTSYGTNYTVNILNDLIVNNSSQYYDNFFSNVQELKQDTNNYASAAISNKINYYPPRIGSLQYESANRYWVNQNLLYEMGGLFLNQPSDQGSSVMLVPSIAITPIKNIDDEYTLKVSINNIRITDTEDISGSVSAQIFTKIDQINHNLFDGTTELTNFGDEFPSSGSIKKYKLKEANTPNAYAIWLRFIPDDPRVPSSTSPLSGTLGTDEIERMKTSTELWKRGFDQVKTITNKTISDNPDKPDVGAYSGYLYSFRIADEPRQIFSSNLLIGQGVGNLAGPNKCSSVTLDSSLCLPLVENYIMNDCRYGEPFILDYTESEVSLVMQSGAL